MGIKENQLPVAESLGEGDMVRIVDSEGHSKQIDKDEIGGSGENDVLIKCWFDWDTNQPKVSSSVPYNEFIDNAYNYDRIDAYLVDTGFHPAVAVYVQRDEHDEWYIEAEFIYYGIVTESPGEVNLTFETYKWDGENVTRTKVYKELNLD